MASAAYKFNVDSFGGGSSSGGHHHHETTRRLSSSIMTTGSSSLDDPGGGSPGGAAAGTAVPKKGGCCGGGKCTAARVKSVMKMFFAQLFSHVGLCALVIGYAIMGAFIFVYLEKDNELATRVEVGSTRKDTLEELYNITGKKEFEPYCLT